MRPHQFQTERVDGRDVSAFQQEKLAPQGFVLGPGRGCLDQRLAQALLHLGGCGVGERDHQQAVNLDTLPGDEVEAALDQRGGLARAGPGREQHRAARLNRPLLLRSASTHGVLSLPHPARSPRSRRRSGASPEAGRGTRPAKARTGRANGRDSGRTPSSGCRNGSARHSRLP